MSGRKSAVASMTPRHFAYLGLMHMLGALAVGAIVNFALTTVIYKNIEYPIMTWPPPFTNILVGEAAVTILLQTTLTWILDGLAVAVGVRKGLVAPLRLPQNPHPWIEWFVGRDDVSKYGSGRKKSIRHAVKFHGKRIGAMILATFVVFGLVTIVLLAWTKASGSGNDVCSMGGDGDAWTRPRGYGFATGITTLLMNYIALIYQGEAFIQGSSLNSGKEKMENEKHVIMK
ncbi:hypothetical protein EC968_001359 [Mortierella alpina]|nr:hypothetical protein EC968_001359 [Mortierella alpina]